MSFESMPGRYPAVVGGYDPDSRMCRISIPGLTDGSDTTLLAEIEYPIGDKSFMSGGEGKSDTGTEIRILAGDAVWVSFIGGDPRYPIITGYRNPSIGNSVEWRRFNHANIEITADGIMRLNADSIEINVKTIITTNAANAIINADTDINGGVLTHNDKNIGDTHTHDGVQPGAGKTGAPSE